MGRKKAKEGKVRKEGEAGDTRIRENLIGELEKGEKEKKEMMIVLRV